MNALEWREGKVRFLDHRLLPGQEIWTTTDDPSVVIGAIQCSAIQGDTTICAAGAYAAVLAALRQRSPMSEHSIASLLNSIEAIEECSPATPGLVPLVERLRKTLLLYQSDRSFELAGALLKEAEVVSPEAGTRMRS